MEANQVNVFAFTMLRDLEKVQHAEEPGSLCQSRSDVRKSDGLDGIDYDLAFIHRISATDFDMRMHPNPHTAGYFSAPDPFA